MSNKLFTKIQKEQLLDGDCVKITRVPYAKIDHAYYRDGKFLSVIDNQEIDTKEYSLEIELHNYKFIAKEDTWYMEGTEAYPDGENYGSENDWMVNGAAIFQGLTYKENFNEMEGTGPAWDGETCSFDEFEITERINQTRQRKLNRLLK